MNVILPRPRFPRGARRAQPHKLLAMRGLGRALQDLAPPPPRYSSLTPNLQLSFWGNDRYGCCPFTTMAFWRALITGLLPKPGTSEIVIPTSSVLNLDYQVTGGYNGSEIPDALQGAETYGLVDANGITHKNGPYGGINYQSQGQVMQGISLFKMLVLGVDAQPLEDAGAGNGSGWVVPPGDGGTNLDHCIAALSYGENEWVAQDIAAKLGCTCTLPSGVDPLGFGVGLFTWGGIGGCPWESYTGMTGEAYVVETDEDRSDSAAWNAIAAGDYQELVALPQKKRLALRDFARVAA